MNAMCEEEQPTEEQSVGLKSLWQLPRIFLSMADVLFYSEVEVRDPRTVICSFISIRRREAAFSLRFSACFALNYNCRY